MATKKLAMPVGSKIGSGSMHKQPVNAHTDTQGRSTPGTSRVTPSAGKGPGFGGKAPALPVGSKTGSVSMKKLGDPHSNDTQTRATKRGGGGGGSRY